MSWAAAVLALVFCAWYVRYVATTASTVDLTPTAWVILLAKTSVELVGASLGIVLSVSAITFVLMSERRWRPA